jgi:hypothetical protein
LFALYKLPFSELFISLVQLFYVILREYAFVIYEDYNSTLFP